MERIEERIATRREERGAILMPGPSPGTPEFSYGFEDQPNGGIPSYFGSGNADPTSGFYFSSRSGANSPEVSTDRAFEGSKSLKFHYDPYPCGGADACVWSEIRFNIAAGGSLLNAQEWWYNQNLYVPANYTHPAVGGNNRKCQFFYDQNDAVGAYDFELWSMGDGIQSYMSLNLFWWNGGKVNVGHCLEASSIPLIAAADRGQWINLKWHIRQSTASLAQDGFARVYKNDVEYYTFRPTTCWGGNADLWWNGLGLGAGYMLGYQNVGFSGGADFYIDPMEFALTDVWGVT